MTRLPFLALISALALAATFTPSTTRAGEDVVPMERYERAPRYEEREVIREYRVQPRVVHVYVQAPVRRVIVPAPVRYYPVEPVRRIVVREPGYGYCGPRYAGPMVHGRVGIRFPY